MAAGLGFKTFATGDVLSAADTNGYLMQGVLVFASAAARDSSITSPQEGQFAYLKDTNVTTYYTGSAWANLDTTGMTNPMTTTGDTIYSSSGSTPARLGIGSTGNVLTVAGGVPTWAAPASGGGMTLLSTTTLSGTSTVINVASGYINLFVLISGVTASANYELAYRVNNISTAYYGNTQRSYSTATDSDPNDAFVVFASGSTSALSSSADNVFTAFIENYDSSTVYKTFSNKMGITNNASALYQANSQWTLFDTTAMTSLKVMTTGAATFSTGTVKIYGVK